MNSRCICGLLALLAIAGCSHSHSLVGTWTVHPDAQNHLASETITYNADGTFNEELSLTDPHLPAPIDLVTKGTWKEVSQDHYQRLVTDIDMSKLLPPPGMNAAEVAKMAQQEKPEFIKSLNKTPEFTAAWTGNDSFTATNAHNTTKTYNRKA